MYLKYPCGYMCPCASGYMHVGTAGMSMCGYEWVNLCMFMYTQIDVVMCQMLRHASVFMWVHVFAHVSIHIACPVCHVFVSMCWVNVCVHTCVRVGMCLGVHMWLPLKSLEGKCEAHLLLSLQRVPGSCPSTPYGVGPLRCPQPSRSLACGGETVLL